MVRQGQVTDGKPVRNEWEVLLGRHISQKLEAQLHPVQPLSAEQPRLPHRWSATRNPAWQRVGRI